MSAYDAIVALTVALIALALLVRWLGNRCTVVVHDTAEVERLTRERDSR